MRIAFLIPIAAVVTFAQNQPRPQQQMAQPLPQPAPEALKRYLNLTDGQLQQMQMARQEAQRQAEEKSRGLEAQLREKHMALQSLLDKGSSDAAAVGRAVLEVRTIEKQRQELQDSVRNSGLSVLNAEQKTRFKAIEDAALLPAATQDAIRLGLVPMARPNGPGPMMGQGPRMGQRPGMGQNPGMNRQPGPPRNNQPGAGGPGQQQPDPRRPQGPPRNE